MNPLNRTIAKETSVKRKGFQWGTTNRMVLPDLSEYVRRRRAGRSWCWPSLALPAAWESLAATIYETLARKALRWRGWSDRSTAPVRKERKQSGWQAEGKGKERKEKGPWGGLSCVSSGGSPSPQGPRRPRPRHWPPLQTLTEDRRSRRRPAAAGERWTGRKETAAGLAFKSQYVDNAVFNG